MPAFGSPGAYLPNAFSLNVCILVTLRFALPACLTFFLLLRLPALGADARPNILLIVADDIGCGGLGCQGNPEIPTPNIVGIAVRSVRFTNAYVTAPICSPSRAGYLTGRYQQRF